ncbi:MAG TPA: 50S ribosomal protein L11 methyltransferase [Steroidobacteraceae bacterium]|jgi:ribosomal protein L11 methyltransferase|nr:50S ribosomal protein L11 methyltransferase [Steroidobacteraceae bacterium]
MGAPWVEVGFELGALDADTAYAACVACGAIAVTFTDAGDAPVLEPLPGEFRLWSATCVRALFASEPHIPPAALVDALSATLARPADSLHTRAVADQRWEREWLKDFHAQRFGARLWICPRHERVADPLAAVVHLEPGLAFGTGSHATTALCLEWLDGHIRGGERIIDYGCGSGILALAAIKLGAAQAFCFDIDPQALIATADNADANAVAAQVTVCARADELPLAADLLIANILAAPLCALAARFAELVRSGGMLVLAGLLEDEAHEVTRANDACFHMRPWAQRVGWVALSGRRREHC